MEMAGTNQKASQQETFAYHVPALHWQSKSPGQAPIHQDQERGKETFSIPGGSLAKGVDRKKKWGI